MRRVAEFEVRTPGQGLHDITDRVDSAVASLLAEREGDGEAQAQAQGQAQAQAQGLATIFIRHTSASLIIQENADPSARADLEAWIARLVPENDPHYTHTAEGADDMPAHIRSVLTAVSLSVPVLDGRLALGTWQGVYLWEHRRGPHRRRVLVHLG